MRWAGIVLLAALAVALFWISMSARRAGKTRKIIQKHLGEDGETPAFTSDSEVGLVHRLVARLGKTRAGMQVRRLLEDSGLQISWATALNCWLAAVVLVPLSAFLITGNVLAGPAALLAIICAPGTVLKVLARKRDRAAIAECDSLAADLALFLRSGIPIEDALSLCARDAGPAIAGAVSRFNADITLGAGTGTALGNLVAALDNRDLQLIAQAVITSTETGSDIRNIMDTIGETVRERAAIKRELSALTVQGRLSGKIVAGLPLIFLALSALASRSTLSVLLGTTPGLVMLGAAGVMNLVGFLWIRKILEIR
ncbi:MAG: type II secretion system F family protein [Candidatus Geothermincolia bacterium]